MTNWGNQYPKRRALSTIFPITSQAAWAKAGRPCRAERRIRNPRNQTLGHPRAGGRPPWPWPGGPGAAGSRRGAAAAGGRSSPGAFRPEGPPSFRRSRSPASPGLAPCPAWCRPGPTAPPRRRRSVRHWPPLDGSPGPMAVAAWLICSMPWACSALAAAISATNSGHLLDAALGHLIKGPHRSGPPTRCRHF